jgi:hypothetical protein
METIIVTMLETQAAPKTKRIVPDYFSETGK